MLVFENPPCLFNDVSDTRTVILLLLLLLTLFLIKFIYKIYNKNDIRDVTSQQCQ